MTEQEAIHMLERMIDPDPWEDDGLSDKAKQALQMGIDALENQVAKKPIITEDIFKCVYKYRCPECVTYLGSRGKHSIIIFEKPKYCSCGQKLDWSEGKG